MSIRTSRRILWLALVLALPVPIAVLGPGLVPPARLLMLAAITLALMALEQSGGAAPQIALVLLAQGLFWVAALWLAAWLLARLLGRLPPRIRAGVALALVGAGLLAATGLELYRTPYAADAPRASLLRVYR